MCARWPGCPAQPVDKGMHRHLIQCVFGCVCFHARKGASICGKITKWYPEQSNKAPQRGGKCEDTGIGQCRESAHRAARTRANAVSTGRKFGPFFAPLSPRGGPPRPSAPRRMGQHRVQRRRSTAAKVSGTHLWGHPAASQILRFSALCTPETPNVAWMHLRPRQRVKRSKQRFGCEFSIFWPSELKSMPPRVRSNRRTA